MKILKNLNLIVTITASSFKKKQKTKKKHLLKQNNYLRKRTKKIYTKSKVKFDLIPELPVRASIEKTILKQQIWVEGYGRSTVLFIARWIVALWWRYG